LTAIHITGSLSGNWPPLPVPWKRIIGKRRVKEDDLARKSGSYGFEKRQKELEKKKKKKLKAEKKAQRAADKNGPGDDEAEGEDEGEAGAEDLG
jgi:hypothetical protein